MKRAKRSKSLKVSCRNIAPFGWWIASYIERAVWDDKPIVRLTARCLAWENTVLLKASNREAAYKKVLRLYSRNLSTFQDNKTNRTGHWVFEGITSLLPIYEKLQDGAEILWCEHTGKTLKGIRSRVKRMKDLEAFDD
ncbi:MAG: DUF4288 domain-containing protein [Nitrospira sp.]|nr:DUF4288 domain-containing protein [Nitrospira sp.]